MLLKKKFQVFHLVFIILTMQQKNVEELCHGAFNSILFHTKFCPDENKKKQNFDIYCWFLLHINVWGKRNHQISLDIAPNVIVFPGLHFNHHYITGERIKIDFNKTFVLICTTPCFLQIKIDGDILVEEMSSTFKAGWFDCKNVNSVIKAGLQVRVSYNRSFLL